MPGQVEIDDLRVGREPREIRLEVGMVETPRSAVKEHDGGPLTHFKTVGHKRGTVDVEPQCVPFTSTFIRGAFLLAHEPRMDAATHLRSKG
jgi:hypothetical protein